MQEESAALRHRRTETEGRHQGKQWPPALIYQRLHACTRNRLYTSLYQPRDPRPGRPTK